MSMVVSPLVRLYTTVVRLKYIFNCKIEDWLSGLRRLPAKELNVEILRSEGSNPSSSAKLIEGWLSGLKRWS